MTLQHSRITPYDSVCNLFVFQEGDYINQKTSRLTCYATDAIGAQWFLDNAYSWENEIRRGRTRSVEFNREAQAQFLENLYTSGESIVDGATPVSGNGCFYDADGSTSRGRFNFNRIDHTDRANQSLAVVRCTKIIRLTGVSALPEAEVAAKAGDPRTL